jgi:hypothetical protein
MSLDNSKAGKIGRCLKCNQKFRVPSEIIEEAETFPPANPTPRPDRASRSRSPRSQRWPGRQPEPPPPKTDDDIMELDGYGLELGEPALQPAENLYPRDEDLKDAEWVDIDSAAQPPIPSRQGKRKNSFLLIVVAGSLIGVIVFGVVALIFWMRSGGTGQQDTAEPPQGSSGPKALETLKQVLGPKGSESPKARTGPSASMLRLEVEGKDVKVFIDFMNRYHLDRNQDQVPEVFELEGRGVSIFGQFWIGFEGQWDDAIGKRLTIVPQDPMQSKSESHLNLPGKGELKVLNGKLGVKEVLKDQGQGDPFLRGEIELELNGQGPRDILNVKGTFEAQVRTLH